MVEFVFPACAILSAMRPRWRRFEIETLSGLPAPFLFPSPPPLPATLFLFLLVIFVPTQCRALASAPNPASRWFKMGIPFPGTLDGCGEERAEKRIGVSKRLFFSSFFLSSGCYKPWRLLYTHWHTCEHIYTYMYVHIHMHTNTQTDTHAPHTPSHTHAHKCTCTCTHTHTHTHSHTLTHKLTHTHSWTHIAW